jgi:hypothetical protein
MLVTAKAVVSHSRRRTLSVVMAIVMTVGATAAAAINADSASAARGDTNPVLFSDFPVTEHYCYYWSCSVVDVDARDAMRRPHTLQINRGQRFVKLHWTHWDSQGATARGYMEKSWGGKRKLATLLLADTQLITCKEAYTRRTISVVTYGSIGWKGGYRRANPVDEVAARDGDVMKRRMWYDLALPNRIRDQRYYQC